MIAANASEALACLTSFTPEVIICDIGLPGMNGYELCRLFRSGQCAKALIVALTGYGQESDVSKAADAGFDLHLTKPVDLKRLLGHLSPRA